MPRLSYLTISGSPHEAGQALGRFGADAVHRHLLASRDWASVMQWRGSAQARAMASLVRERFPCVWAELEGLAAGLGLPFDDVFLWNCRGDLWAMAPDGCTTVQLPGKRPSGQIIPLMTSLPIWTMSGSTPASRNAIMVCFV